MEVIKKEQADADVEREIVSKDTAEASAQEAEAAELKAEAEEKLAEAVPMLEAATKVLKELQRNDIVEVGAVKQPVTNVVLTMELACHMFEYKPKKEMIGRVANDPHGFFECARQNLLSKAR